jgi:hypothetical protein
MLIPGKLLHACLVFFSKAKYEVLECNKSRVPVHSSLACQGINDEKEKGS